MQAQAVERYNNMDESLRIQPKVVSKQLDSKKVSKSQGASGKPKGFMESIQKTIDINLQGLISGSSQQGPLGMKSDQITDKEIQIHWTNIKTKWREEVEEDRIKEEEMQKLSQSVNHNLRYQETLILNKKGYQTAFKAITRKKRDA